jgi:itaconyl-CoA hydratase/mesaconyl-C4 CoA hydratase
MTTDVGLSDIGAEEHIDSELSADHAAKIGATIDAAAIPGVGDALPLLWHWAYFTPTVPTSALDADRTPVPFHRAAQ